MTQPANQLLLVSKPLLVSAMVVGLLALLYFLSGEIIHALCMLLIGLGLLVIRAFAGVEEQEGNSPTKVRYGSLAVTIAVAVAIIGYSPQALPWAYPIPLLIFFFFPIKQAIWIVGGFSLVVFWQITQTITSFEYVQVTINYLLCVGITGSFVFLRENRTRQLKPLRRTDNLTKAATREHLDDDLTKEIQRSEREGSDLACCTLAIDPSCLEKLSSKDQDAVTIDIGKLLHNNLRLFDSYYLWEHHEFLIVLPHTSSSQAMKIANALRTQIRKELTAASEKITVSVGVAGLNVGDDSSTLTSRAASALKQAQAKGTNRSLLFREESEREDLDGFNELGAASDGMDGIDGIDRGKR